MPLRAVSAEKNINAFEFDETSWANLKASYRNTDLKMPCCGNAAIPKTSTLGNFFFAHTRKGNCTSEPESAEHIYIKSLVAKAASSVGWSVITERLGESPNGEKWTADVFCEKGNAQVALEVQLSHQSAEATLARQKRYAESGVRCLWFLSSETFKDSYLKSSRETPYFLLSIIEVGEEPTVIQFDIELTKFVKGVLIGNLSWQEQPSEPQQTEYIIKYFHDICWRCNQPIKQIYGYAIDVYGDEAKTIPNASAILEEIHRFTPNNALELAGLNTIGRFDKINGKTVNFPYCNVCMQCGAPQDNFYLMKKLHEHLHASSTDAIGVKVTLPSTIKTGKWTFQEISAK